MKTLEFVRYGNLSANHKQAYKLDTFHSPPLKKGIYVFHPNFIEPFLYKWKEKDGKKIKQKRIKYSGKIWVHIHYNHPEIKVYRKVKSWYETDTNSIEKLFSMEKTAMGKSTNNAFKCFGCDYEWNKNFYKWSSYDHLELFIGEKI